MYHTRSNKLKVMALAALSLYAVECGAQWNWPEVTRQAKPWTRWWWEGSAVNKKDLSWNMETYSKAGLGGLEITPIYGVKGHEKEFIPFLSPQWINMLQYTLQEGKRLDMGIDVANATGWPFGGPWVSDNDASKELFWKKYEVKGGAKLDEPIVFVQQPLVRADGVAPDIKDIKQPYGSNANLQVMALDQLRFQRNLPLTILMAYNGKGKKMDLTNKVDKDGRLNWTAPAGNDWHLYALFLGDHGKMVERAAPGGEGFVIDHFSQTALAHYLGHFDSAFKGHDLSGIRAFFNDSYEVDDARGQSNFTPAFFAEFIKRRGYDLRFFLPALFGDGDKETVSRVVCDYRETISELLLDNFTRPWHVWGSAKGALIRNQSHGSPANILDLYAAIDIPETEGNDVLRFKFATSAAHVSGKPLASSESATWLHDHFLSSLGDVKQAIDKFFVGGVNHVFYHGISYSPKDEPWPGWLFYAAVHFQPTNPFWKHFSTLNEYIARCQSFLQQGTPDNDVLIYYPVYDSYAEPGSALLKHYDALKPDFNGTGFASVSETMLNKGYTFDFISDKQIAAMKAEGAKLLSGKQPYKTIVLPDCRYMPLTTWNKVVSMAKEGATVLVYKNLPVDVPGLGQLEERRKTFAALKSSLQFADVNGVKTASIGTGRVVLADDITTLLQVAGIQREVMTDEGLQFVRRRDKDGYCYFVTNAGNKAIEKQVSLATHAASVVVYDPMQKQAGLAAVQQQSDGQTAVYLQLQPGESCILHTYVQAQQGAAYVYYQPAGQGVSIKGKWTIRFEEGGPVLPQPVTTDKLVSWTELGGEDVKAFSGIAAYQIGFATPQGSAEAWRLHLDQVYGSAEVYLNGKKLITLLGPDYSIDIPATALQPQNQLEIKVANLMANRIIDMDKHQVPYRIFYNTNFQAHDKANRGSDGLFTAINWNPLPSGINGNVTLTPLKKVSSSL
ncbi:alpha-L-rhamnosidase [Filimonas lacunae]|uniref:Alpha-L-rhamnosidase n=1 Tax=Filimonas lacunae TaxID=477680 RepID=A0A173MK48_9BACT|nr:glycosyl hydrolase [Filimonas lacunae]BAV07974.1 alpha-L-rhamnosidase [Filimonas lacunae]SIT07322.1 alpha-L-rhamnosidase [Filimonas lacunae]